MALFVRKLLFFLLLITSSQVFADSYPAIFSYGTNSSWTSDALAACTTNYANANYSVALIGNSSCQVKQISTGNIVLNSSLTTSYQCPGGGTLSGSTCINATSCPTSTVRSSSTGKCPPPPPTSCTAPQVLINNACVMPPDCNASWSTGGQFYDVNTHSCATVPPDQRTLCVGADDKFCPPIADCKAPTFICTNDPAVIASEAIAKGAIVVQAKASADVSATKATAALTQASTPVNYFVEAQQVAQSQADSFQTALAASQSNPQTTSTQLATAASNYSNSLKNLSDASSKVTNSQATSSQVAVYKTQATDAAAAIPAAPTSGHAQQLSYAAATALTNALNALNDTIVGGGAGSGSGSNSGTGTGSGSCPGCAQETTLESLMAGSGNALHPQTGNDHFDDTVPDGQAAQAKSDYQAKFNEVKTSLGSLFQLSSGGVGQLPSFDFGTIKGVHVVVDLNRYSGQLSIVGTSILFVATFIAVMIFLG